MSSPFFVPIFARSASRCSERVRIAGKIAKNAAMRRSVKIEEFFKNFDFSLCNFLLFMC